MMDISCFTGIGKKMRTNCRIHYSEQKVSYRTQKRYALFFCTIVKKMRHIIVTRVLNMKRWIATLLRFIVL